jgi:hypothetical protein
MSDERDLTRSVRSWLETGATGLPDRVLDQVLAQVAETPQHRTSWVPGRGPWIAAAAAVLAVAVVIGLGLLPVTVRIGDADPAPAPAPLQFVPLPIGPIEPGAYEVAEEFAVELAFTVPPGWSKFDVGPDHVSIVQTPGGRLYPTPPDGTAIGFFVVDNLFADPCLPGNNMFDPPVGPTVEDLADALATVPAYRASERRPVVVSGYSGETMRLDLEVYMCSYSQVMLWRTPSGWVRNPQGEEEQNRLWILDVDGVRLVINALSFPGASDASLAELEAIVDSVRIRPREADGD